MEYDIDDIDILNKNINNEIIICLLERNGSALERPTLASIKQMRHKWTSYRECNRLVETLKKMRKKPPEVVITIDGKKLNYETPEKEYLKIYKHIKRIIPLCDVLCFNHEEDEFKCKYFIKFIEEDLKEIERILLKYFDDGKTELNKIFTPMIMEFLPNKVHISDREYVVNDYEKEHYDTDSIFVHDYQL